MRDADIRQLYPPCTMTDAAGIVSKKVVHELRVCMGRGRIDVAVLDSDLSGFEIKSDVDSLARLRTQIPLYNSVCDRIELIVGPRLCTKAQLLIPSWWGMQIVTNERTLRAEQIRPASLNQDLHPFSIAQLLWKSEALSLLADSGAATGMYSKPRREIWKRLADVLPLEQLKQAVLFRLKMRPMTEGYRVSSN